MTLHRHLRLIPATLALGLSLLATATAQSDDTQEPDSSETITSQVQLENHLQAVLAHYQELENQLSKATTEAEAKNIWHSMLRKMPEDRQGGSFISTNLQNIPLKEQKRILAPYKEQMQSRLNKLPVQLKRLGFAPQRASSYMDQMETLHDFFETWERLVLQYPEASDADEIFQQYLTRLTNGHQQLASIRTPNDRQRIEETILDRSKPYNAQDDIWITELQTILKKLPPETQKRLYIQYLHFIRTILPSTPEKASGQYHYLVYQSELLLQYLSKRQNERYILQKSLEDITEQKQDSIPAGMPEKEILVRQNINLTNQLGNLLSTVTSKAAAAAIGPRANDLKDQLLQNMELLICADDVSPEEQARIDRQYGLSIQQATDELNRQVQRLASKNSYRNTHLEWVVNNLLHKPKAEHLKNEPHSSEQTEETPSEPDEN